MNRYALLFVGPQGSGKGTQAKYFSSYLNAPLIGMGEIFRRHSSRSTILSKTIARYIKKGILLPNQIIRIILIKKLRQYRNEPFLLFDGVPRTLSQKKSFDLLLTKYNISNSKIIVIDIPILESEKRLLKRKRDDDTESTISKRLKEYYSKTQPMIHAFNKENRAIIIDGTPSIDQVTQSIVYALKKDTIFQKFFL